MFEFHLSVKLYFSLNLFGKTNNSMFVLFCSFLLKSFFYSVVNDLARLASALVGLDGLEPSTSRLSAECSNQLSYRPLNSFGTMIRFLCSLPRFRLRFRSLPIVYDGRITFNLPRSWPPAPPAGGDKGNRTLDPLLAGQVLSQLSYTPLWDYA